MKDLEEYERLKAEIHLNQQRIQKYHDEANQLAGDTVTGCTKDNSIKHTITIRGYPILNQDAVDRLTRALHERNNRLKKKLMEIEDFIGSVEDSQIRQIITMKYVIGESWIAVARKVCKSMSEATPRKKLSRYFSKQSIKI